MALGLLIITGISIYYLLNSRKLEGYFLSISSLLLLVLSVIKSFVLPSRIVSYPDYDWPSVTLGLYLVETVLWVVFGIGFLLLILRAVRLRKRSES